MEGDANLTLNLGLRYSVFNLFHKAHGKANPFDFATCGAQGFCGVGASFGQQNYGDIDPRIGVIWAAGENLPAKNEVPFYSVTNVTYPVAPYFSSGNLVPGVPLTPPGGRTVSHWINAAAFTIPAADSAGVLQTLGNAPRDLFPGTGHMARRYRRCQDGSDWRARSCGGSLRVLQRLQPGVPDLLCRWMS